MAENKDDEMFSMSYEDARNKYGVGVGNNKYFMSPSDFEKRKEERNKKAEKSAEKTEPKKEPKKQQSLVANKFGEKKEKTWNDVKSEYNNDPAKIADYLNNAKDYTPGNFTKKGMEEFGYAQGADGKWTSKPKTETPATSTSTTETNGTKTTTTDDAITGIEDAANGDPKVKGFVDNVTNPKTGDVDEQKALKVMSQYEQKLVEAGAGSFDEDGKFVFKDTTKKGWEDWATMLSVGASVIGLAMGVPIIPVNFRKITNKDEKDAKIREFQKQYTDIMAGNAAKIKDVESSAEAGDYIKQNQDSIDKFTNYAENTAAYGARSNIDVDKETKLINEKLKADQALVDAEFKSKIGEMKLSHEQEKDLQELLSELSTGSAIEVLDHERYGYLIDMAKEMKDAGMDDKAIALKIQSLAGNTATKQNLEHAKSIVGMIKDIGETASGFLGFGKKKK